MSTYILIVNESPVPLWGLTSRERVRRLLDGKDGNRLVDRLEAVPADGSVLLVRGDYLMDARTLRALTQARDTVLQAPGPGGQVTVAAHVPVPLARALLAALTGAGDGRPLPPEVATATLEDLAPPFQEQLRKVDPPFVLPISGATRPELERLLFGAAYKGVTDLVTRFLWPVPARWGVRLFARLGVTPNQITVLNWLLAVAVLLLFGYGEFGWGLVLAWVMTYLDTVDGKLARVTVTSSRLGHYLDHVLDLISPPFWYLAWGLGLGAFQPAVLRVELSTLITLIFAGYILGRLVEGAFKTLLGRFGIFCWRRVDSYSRLVTARRNPALILLTGGALAGRPDLGLEAVALWTLVSTLFLLVRLGMAAYARATAGPLTSWLAEVGRDPSDHSLAVRWFAGGSGRSPGATARSCRRGP